MAFGSILLFAIIIIMLHTIDATTLELDPYLDRPDSIQPTTNHMNRTSFNGLPLDTMIRIVEYSDKQTIHSFMRSCRSHLFACTEYIHLLLAPLINANINIKQLLQVPLTDPIKIDCLKMHQYFREKNHPSSIYMGIDSNTNMTFIAFALIEATLNPSYFQLELVTIVFHGSSVSKVLALSSIRTLGLLRYNSLWYQDSKARDIEAINILLTRKTIKNILHSKGTWCLTNQWESVIFWHRFWLNSGVIGSAAIFLVIIVMVLFSRLDVF
eukprot:966322_1